MSSAPLRESLPFDRTTIFSLLVLAGAYASMTALAMVEFPSWSNSRFSPIEVAVWLALFASCAVAVNQFRTSTPQARRAFQVSVAAVATITVLHSADFAIDWSRGSAGSSALAAGWLANATVAIILAAAVIWLVGSRHVRRWLIFALLAIVGYQLFAVYAETYELTASTANSANTLRSTEFIELLFVELYLVGLILAGGRISPAVRFGTASDANELGTFARFSFARLSLLREARHPPALIAFVPGLTSVFVILTALVMTAYAAGPLRQAGGPSSIRQFFTQLKLWFRHHIDPPSYYALDLYRSGNFNRAGRYLTRYETKNGLFHVLNYEGRNARPKGELNDKQLFMGICKATGIPCPQTLAIVTAEGTQIQCSSRELQTSLFCKPQRGFGAIGTLAYEYDPLSDKHLTEDGRLLDRDALFDDWRSHATRHSLIVQKWLVNHPDIADLADRSLLVFRVVTCMDASGQPVVTHAMLRLLAKLECNWKHLPDGEYAAPINLETGRLGQLTGDSPRTASLRYYRHPVTGGQIDGRVVAEWPAIASMAERVHRAIYYRRIVGWDIALTPEGPVVLEGNSNLDVMFLQRVHNQPMGESALAPLLKAAIDELYAA